VDQGLTAQWTKGSPLSGCVFESNGLVPVPVVRGAVHGPVVPRIPIPLSIGKGTHFLVVGERGGEEVAVEELLCLEVLQTDHTPTLDWSPAHTHTGGKGTVDASQHHH